ncbi:MAG: hypothetical protein ABFC62_03715, partial [Clostridiaceae bacterium]
MAILIAKKNPRKALLRRNYARKSRQYKLPIQLVEKPGLRSSGNRVSRKMKSESRVKKRGKRGLPLPISQLF